jgi:hypothetical protein
MAYRALVQGLGPAASTGLIRHYLDSLASPEKHSFPILYGEFVYVFGCRKADGPPTLLTIYRAPGDVIKAFLRRSMRSVATASSGMN